LAFEACPPDWLDAFMSGLKFEESKQRYPRLEIAMKSKSVIAQSRYYILMLSLAFDSAKAALEALAEDRTDFECGYKPERRRFFSKDGRLCPVEN
jgi:hypothetical protein